MADTATNTGTGSRQPIVVAGLVLVTLALSARLLLFVDRYSVDVLYGDQWDFWNGLFTGADPWTLWRWQHGPHRQGLGQWVIAATAWATDWNTRADGFVAATIITLAAVAGLALARSVRGRWSPADVAIPLVVMTIWQYEILVVSPNPSHGPLPLLLAMLLALATQVPRPRLRVAAIATVAVVASHTGFAIFLSFVGAAFLAVLLVRSIRLRESVPSHLLALAAVVASLAIFFSAYPFNPAVECFRFPDPEPMRYVSFLCVLFFPLFEPGAAGWVQGAWAVLGASGALLCLGLTAWGAWRTLGTLGRDRLGAAVFVLAGFTLLFAVNTAVGRSCLGPGAARAQRYVPYLLPFLTAVYLFLSTAPLPRRMGRLAVVAFCAFALGKEVLVSGRAREGGERYRVLKQSFVRCYLETADLVRCSERWPVYPDAAASGIQEKLDFLRDRRLGPFRNRSP